ncbi:hypothetical protein HG536_0D01730 [Torulaspora globosa]|uniref:Trafficking protein particle complex subunit 11 domain-containing protein n=1 Tax=Torulaspora globosa TaxID=48254 RepID=A0A7G3ZGL5_9SACH|nr:uncharacterized protein HG536_0D01730 [Torulaspora globosa]QLL32651.1 hypothetical protein HG536_0D01730 [Torulaspora globosa]
MTSSEVNSTGAVYVSYFDPFDIFESIKQPFLELFPLRNVHWKAFNGSLKTVDEIPVNLVTETKTFERENEDIRLFIRLVVVNCISADDYRAKVRPLIKQWLTPNENGDCKKDMARSPLPVILLYANSEVMDFKLFKSTSLIDKVAKDFPDVKALELKSVYKSPKEKEEFWGQMSQHIKSCVLDVFQSRLMYNQDELEKVTDTEYVSQEMLFRENILELYLALNMLEEAKTELEQIKHCLWNKSMKELPNGELEHSFLLSQENNEQFRIGEALAAKQLTKYEAEKYFFVKEFQIFMRDSPNSMNYGGLYKLIRQFLRSASLLFIQEKGFLEFKISFLDCCLLHLRHRPQSPLKEVTAELLLIRRDCWLQGVLGCTNFSLIGKIFPSTDTHYSFDRYQYTYDTEQVFHETYAKYTKEIISLLSQCEEMRQRAVDILSIEIGFLHYQRKEYDKAVALFLSCYEYYMQSRWDLIGIEILKVFIDSLVQCSNLRELEIDDELVPASVVLSNAYLNIVRISKDIAEKGEWWRKFTKLQQANPTDLVYATKDLFQISLEDHVRLAGPNILEIDVIIKSNGIPEDIKVDSIVLVLKSSDDTFMKFQREDMILSRGTTKCLLQTTEIAYGNFKAVSLEISVDSTTFVKEFLDNDASELLIEPIYDPRSIILTVEHAPQLNLGEYALRISCCNSDRLRSSDAVITVQQESLNSIYPVSFTEDGLDNSKHITEVNETCIVPYYLKEPVASFSVTANFSFTKIDCETKFSEIRCFHINCCLPVSVSVEDIFKRDLFIFKFLLNSSTIENPVVLHSTRMLPPSNSKQYEIQGHFQPETSLCLSANINENCLNCYQITTNQSFMPTDCFHLQISYNTLKEQLDNLVTDAVLVQGDVNWYHRFEPWKLVWQSGVLPLLHYDYDAFKESIVIVLIQDSLDLQRLSKFFKKLSIEEVVSQKMTECLLRVIEGVQLSDIDVNAYTENLAPRRLMVPVDLPKFEQFFYVRLNTEENHGLKVGVAIAFSIKIESLNAKWGHEGLAGKFLFEIISSNEWLVHGKKRMLITCEITEIALHLIPLKRGYLNFPRIEIINIETEEPSRIDNANCFDTVLVF